MSDVFEGTGCQAGNGLPGPNGRTSLEIFQSSFRGSNVRRLHFAYTLHIVHSVQPQRSRSPGNEAQAEVMGLSHPCLSRSMNIRHA